MSPETIFGSSISTSNAEYAPSDMNSSSKTLDEAVPSVLKTIPAIEIINSVRIYVRLEAFSVNVIYCGFMD